MKFRAACCAEFHSRWYKAKYCPWNKIKTGDTVYFKNSGELVKMKARVSGVRQFDGLTPKKVKELLIKYGRNIGIEEKIPECFERFKDKKYCVLIFLKNPAKIEPFEIDKTGFGVMSAWITVDSISRIKK